MNQIQRHFHRTGVNLKTILKKSKGSQSSNEWLSRQLNDPYVKKAREMGYRARSAFKLIEIDEKVKILSPGMTIVECGAAPGAWTQVAVEKINSTGKKKNLPLGQIIGVDLLPIEPLNGATFLSNSDFTDERIQDKIKELLNDGKTSDEPCVDLIMSDMAPDATGTHETDHYRIIGLAEEALRFAIDNGKFGSTFLCKLWDGIEKDGFEKNILEFYESCRVIKPKASRQDSSELYFLALNKLYK